MGYKTESLSNRWLKEIENKKQKTQKEVLEEFFQTDLGKQVQEIHEKNKKEQRKIKELYEKVKNK